MIRIYFLLPLFLALTITSYSQTNNCNNNTGGQIISGTSCNPTNMNSNNNSDYWDGASGCNAEDNDDVWAWFVATSTMTTITFNPSNNNHDPILTLFTGPCDPNMTSLACADDGLNGDNETINYPTDIGTTYRIRVQRFSSNGNMNGTICVFGNNLTPTNEDCSGATTVCDDSVISGNSSGSGNFNDLGTSNSGCLDTEYESSWYYFQASTSGDIELTITTTSDYDFAIWGPYPGAISCPPTTLPIRCSFAGFNGNTGLAIGSGDTSEDDFGDGFVDEINASAGDSYILLLDNFTADGNTFTLDWTLSNGASLDCTLLPVVFGDFHITKMDDSNLLNWNTYSEANNAYFNIQILDEFNEFQTIGSVSGLGNSSELTPYVFEHLRPLQKINVYRLVQVDFDGKETIYSTRKVDNTINTSKIVGTYNMIGQKVDLTYRGIVIQLHEDGSTTRIYQNN